MVNLASALDRSIAELWPVRTQRERLLDLGERKAWTDEDAFDASEGLAAWLQSELDLPDSVETLRFVLPCTPTEAARRLGEALAASDGSDGVARWIQGLAPALGTAAKTLANSLSDGLKPSRPDHRWLALLGRVLDGRAAPAAWAYHLRTRSRVEAELTAGVSRDELDAGDAVLLASLIALWQRRRPTEDVRANRGRPTTRRSSPMPMAAMADDLVAPGQLPHLTKAAEKVGSAKGRDLLLVTVEAALTAAHLVVHPTRGRGASSTQDGERWLGPVDDLLARAAPALLTQSEVEVIRFRVERMRAWRDGSPQTSANALALESPYVRACVALEQARAGSTRRPEVLPEVSDLDAPGLFMLWPQLKRLRRR